VFPNIVLIGFMGSGKSSVGRRLATRTSHRFVDTDELVATRAGRSITQIFAEHGETHFRDLETAALLECVGRTGIVLATGGGIILREENRETLHRIGPVVWLDADPDALFERVSRNKKRPLLQTEDPRASFDTLLASRREIYAATADFRVDSTGESHDDVAQAVLNEVERIQKFTPGV
jgi:shikimate kinase